MAYWLLATLLFSGFVIICYYIFRAVGPIARLRWQWIYYSDTFRISSEIPEKLVHQTIKESERGYNRDQPWRLRSPATELARAAAAREVLKRSDVRLLLVKAAALCIGAIVLCIALWLVAPAAVVGGIAGATAAAVLSYRRRRLGRVVPARRASPDVGSGGGAGPPWA